MTDAQLLAKIRERLPHDKNGETILPGDVVRFDRETWVVRAVWASDSLSLYQVISVGNSRTASTFGGAVEVLSLGRQSDDS